jgi:hypothetical protein
MQCEVHILNGNTPYNFDQIVALYRTVCANLDRTVKRPRTANMNANNHNIFDSDDEDDNNNTNSYRANNHNFVDDDKDLEDDTAYLIFYNNRVYRPRLNKTTWEE